MAILIGKTQYFRKVEKSNFLKNHKEGWFKAFYNVFLLFLENNTFLMKRDKMISKKCFKKSLKSEVFVWTFCQFHFLDDFWMIFGIDPLNM